jgi:DNA-binding transcriptional ArsR family regulator
MVAMTDPSDEAQPPQPLPTRIVQDVETLKVLSDPVRVAILRVLMDGPRTAPKVRSAKELAAELGEPQTKLYRHIKQLLASDLIQVAETRLVSGIVEHRYRAGQWSLDIDPAFFGQDAAGGGDAATAFATIMDAYRDEFVADIRAGRVRFGPDTPGDSYRRAVSSVAVAKVAPAKATEFRDRLATLVHDIADCEQDEDGVEIGFMASFYSPVDPD